MANYALAKNDKIINVIVVVDESSENLEGLKTYFEADEIFLGDTVGPSWVKIDGAWVNPSDLESEETPLESIEP
jgi:hypothetical protein